MGNKYIKCITYSLVLIFWFGSVLGGKKMKLNNLAARYQRTHELGSLRNLVCLSVCLDDIVERLDSSMNHIMPNFDII